MSTAVRRAGRLIAVLAVLAMPAAPAAAQRPDPSADAALLVDTRTGEVLFEENAGERHAIASTTKLMTALLALEEADLKEMFTAPAYDALPVESKINLRRGETMTVDDLLVALLLESANDAAVTIANGVSGSRSAFVDEMNTRAEELGLDGTSFANPIGLDDPQNYSTARDLAALSRRLMRNGRFAEIVDLPSATLRSGSRPRTIDNRNDLVRRVAFVDGIKTGHTGQAGYVLIGSARRRGARVTSVLLGASSESERDAESLALLRYGLRQYRRVRPLQRGVEVAEVDVEGRDEDAALTTARPVRLTIRRGEQVRQRVNAPEELEGPIPEGAEVGTVDLVYRGEVVRSVPLVTAAAVPEPSTSHRLWSGLGTVAITLALLLGGTGMVLVGLRQRALRLRRERRASRR